MLQGHIWRIGYENGELKGSVFEDVPEALAKWDARGIKTYIYSSGSREAQKLIFGNTNFGDLRVYLSGFFDTTIGYVQPWNFSNSSPLGAFWFLFIGWCVVSFFVFLPIIQTWELTISLCG